MAWEGRRARERWGFCQGRLGLSWVDLAGRYALGAGCAFSVETDESQVDQRLHIWAEVDGLLRPSRDHSSAEVKVSPEVKVLGLPGWGVVAMSLLPSTQKNVCCKMSW